MLKALYRFGKWNKTGENIDGFEDNCDWTCCRNFCHLWQEYMWWSVIVLKSGPKISDPTNGNNTLLNFCDINGTFA